MRAPRVRYDLTRMPIAAVRRYVAAVACALVSVQLLGVALQAARFCVHREHTHAGVAAPDCPMHHHGPAQLRDSGHRAHHAGRHSGGDDEGRPRMSCHCPSDVAAMSAGPMAIVLVALSYSPSLERGAREGVTRPSIVELRSSPPSPPPR